MNCKPNDFAVVVRVGLFDCNLRGLFVTVSTVEATPRGPCWWLADHPKCPECGRLVEAIPDAYLQPIRPAPQQDSVTVEKPAEQVA